MFDAITIDWSRINSPAEWGMLILFVGSLLGAFYIWRNRKRDQANTVLDENTIKSYQRALEAQRVDFQSQLDHCSAQHEDSKQEIAEVRKEMKQNAKERDELRGEVNLLKEIPLIEIRDGIKSISKTNGKILDQLKNSATILVKDTQDTKNAVSAVRSDLKSNKSKIDND